MFFFLGYWETIFFSFFFSNLLLDMEDLAAIWDNFSLFEKEKFGYTMRADHRTREYMLAAKFLTPCFLIMEVVARTFKQLWRSTNGFKIRGLGDHKFLFVFDNLPDIDRIIKN